MVPFCSCVKTGNSFPVHLINVEKAWSKSSAFGSFNRANIVSDSNGDMFGCRIEAMLGSSGLVVLQFEGLMDLGTDTSKECRGTANSGDPDGMVWDA